MTGGTAGIFHQFCGTFEDLFYHSIVINDEVLKQYSKEWKRPAVIRDMERYDSLDDETDRGSGISAKRSTDESSVRSEKQPIGRIGEALICACRYWKNISGCV